MLDLFIGETEYRRKKFIQYLDNLLEYHWKHRSGMTEHETILIGDPKRLQKVLVYMMVSGA